MFKYILAAAAGVTLGMLFAPKAGEKLREDLSDHMNDSIERGKGAARGISKRARELGDQAQQQFRDVKAAI
jgi:gas vesicle protein